MRAREKGGRERESEWIQRKGNDGGREMEKGEREKKRDGEGGMEERESGGGGGTNQYTTSTKESGNTAITRWQAATNGKAFRCQTLVSYRPCYAL